MVPSPLPSLTLATILANPLPARSTSAFAIILPALGYRKALDRGPKDAANKPLHPSFTPRFGTLFTPPPRHCFVALLFLLDVCFSLGLRLQPRILPNCPMR